MGKMRFNSSLKRDPVTEQIFEKIYVDREVIKEVPATPEVLYVDRFMPCTHLEVAPVVVEKEVIKFVDREVRIEVPADPEQIFIDHIRVVEKVKVPPMLVVSLVLQTLIIIYLVI